MVVSGRPDEVVMQGAPEPLTGVEAEIAQCAPSKQRMALLSMSVCSPLPLWMRTTKLSFPYLAV